MIKEKCHIFEWELSKKDLKIIYLVLKNSEQFISDCRLQSRTWEIMDEIDKALCLKEGVKMFDEREWGD